MPATTTDWSAEFAAGRWDVERWARVFLDVKLHRGQVRMTKAYLARTQSRWRALYFWIMVAAGNRAGKTLGLAVIILHSCVYRMGLEPPDPRDIRAVQHWGKVPYHWWHFAIEQGPAEQVFTEIATLLGGVHPAQKNGCPWADAVGGADKIAILTDTGLGPWCTGPKERGEYAWIKLVPDLGGAEIHFRSTKAKALSAVGQNMHGLSFDEAGLQESPSLKYLMEEVMHNRRLGTGGQFILISTPSAATSAEFEDLWTTGDPDDPFQKPRRFSMRMSSRDNIGYGLDGETFEAMIEGMPDGWVRQNIDGYFIQADTVWFSSKSVDAAFSDEMAEARPPKQDAIYLHALDPGLKDTCWSMVFEKMRDGTIEGVSLDRIVGKQTTRGIVALGARDYHLYGMKGRAFVDTGVDTTALGGHMFRELIEEQVPTVKSIEFGGSTQVKRRLLSDLRSALDEGRIRMPNVGYWGDVRKQLRNYKLLDRKQDQDAVMCLAIIVKLLRQSPSHDVTPTRFDATADWRSAYGRPEDDGINARTLRAKLAASERARRSATMDGTVSRESA